MESYLIITLISLIIIFKYLNTSDVIYVEFFNFKTKKNKKYLVRDVDDKKDAIKTLLTIEEALKSLIEKILSNENIKHHQMYRYMLNIQDKIDSVEIQESSSDSIHTSYSINKGETLVFCLRSKKTGKIHDLNDLLYVAIHELAHIGCPEVGHTDLFYEINKFLINQAIQYNIYKYIDYNLNSREYCGMELTVTVADN